MNTNPTRLYFLWDYDLSAQQVHYLLREGAPADKTWLISRILNYARWDDIWRYLSVADIRAHFSQLYFRRPQDRELWAYALKRWSHDR
jgi:hypothetical protein